MARLESNDRYYDDYIYPNYFIHFDTVVPVNYFKSDILQNFVTSPIYIANEEGPTTECNKIYLGSPNTKRALLDNTEISLIPNLVSWYTHPNTIDYYIEGTNSHLISNLAIDYPLGYKASNSATFCLKEVA